MKNWFIHLRISKHNYKRESTVKLLLISDDTKQHSCWIKDISLNTFKTENSLDLIMSIVNQTKTSKFNFPKREQKNTKK